MLRRYSFTLFLIYINPAFYNVSFAGEVACPRIISQSPYISDILNYLGMEKCIVGASRYSKRDLPRTGGLKDPDSEAIDALMPDLIIASNRTPAEILKRITPKDAKALHLQSFNKMSQLEDNMNSIIQATGWQQAKPKVESFKKAWRSKIKQLKGNNKKVLLLSSCSGNAYSFGPNSRMYDLFAQAGFHVVETKEKIRHVRPGTEIEDVTKLLNHYQPDLLFIFERRLKKQCQMIIPKVPVKILSFDGKHFLHPTPAILTGLDELISKNKYWN